MHKKSQRNSDDLDEDNKKRVKFDSGEEIHITNEQMKKEKEERDKEKHEKLQARIDIFIEEREQFKASIKRLEEENAIHLKNNPDASGPKPESIDWSKAEIQIKSFEFQEPFLERERSIEVFETYKDQFFSGTKEGMLCWTEWTCRL